MITDILLTIAACACVAVACIGIGWFILMLINDNWKK